MWACSMIDDCQAGEYSATPAPIRLQNSNRVQGVVRPSTAIAVNPMPAALAKPRPVIATLRRSNMRSEEHTSELQSLMRTSYAVFCLKKKNNVYIQPIKLVPK